MGLEGEVKWEGGNGAGRGEGERKKRREAAPYHMSALTGLIVKKWCGELIVHVLFVVGVNPLLFSVSLVS